MSKAKEGNPQISFRVEPDFFDKVLADADSTGVTVTEFSRTILNRYYENGKSFSSKEQEAEISSLKSKLEVADARTDVSEKDKRIAELEKQLASHAERVDKQYKDITELKRLNESHIARIEKKDARYMKLYTEACSYANSVREERKAIIQYCDSLDALIGDAVKAKIPAELIERMKDVCEAVGDHKEVRLSGCGFSADGNGRNK